MKYSLIDQLFKKRCLLIHNALHNQNITAIQIANEKYTIQIGKAGVRYLVWNNHTFMQENPKFTNWISREAATGNNVTWIIRPNKIRWGLLINSNLIKE